MDKEKLREILEKLRYGVNPCGYPIGGEAFNKAEKMWLDQAISQILELEEKEKEELKEDAAHKEMDWFAEKNRADRYQEALERIAKGGADCNFQDIAVKALQGIGKNQKG